MPLYLWNNDPTWLKHSKLSLTSAINGSILRTLSSGFCLCADRPFPTTLPVYLKDEKFIHNKDLKKKRKKIKFRHAALKIYTNMDYCYYYHFLNDFDMLLVFVTLEKSFLNVINLWSKLYIFLLKYTNNQKQNTNKCLFKTQFMLRILKQCFQCMPCGFPYRHCDLIQINSRLIYWHF